MVSQIYRSARIVIQNSTNALWTLDAAEVLCGQWLQAKGPASDAPHIDPQSAVTINNISTTLHTSAEGFVRYGSSNGQFHIHWSRPWVGPFELRTEIEETAGKSLLIDVEINEDLPAYAVALVTIRPEDRRF